jgi:hypothetical protein
MKKIIHVFLLLLPLVLKSQSNPSTSYQEDLANYRKIVEENQKLSPDKFIYTGPVCLKGARSKE